MRKPLSAHRLTAKLPGGYNPVNGGRRDMYPIRGHQLQKGICVSAVSFLTILCLCTPGPCRFSYSLIYARDRFSGRDIGNHTIALLAPLTPGGIAGAESFSFHAYGEMARNTLPGMDVIKADSLHAVLLRKLGAEAFEHYSQLLFKGEIALLQTCDSLWNAVGADYLFVVRIHHGMDIRTFNGIRSRRLALEAEVWDCAGREVAWRCGVGGSCDRADVSDEKFITEAVRVALASLPRSHPSYDTKSW